MRWTWCMLCVKSTRRACLLYFIVLSHWNISWQVGMCYTRTHYRDSEIAILFLASGETAYTIIIVFGLIWPVIELIIFRTTSDHANQPVTKNIASHSQSLSETGAEFTNVSCWYASDYYYDIMGSNLSIIVLRISPWTINHNLDKKMVLG